MEKINWYGYLEIGRLKNILDSKCFEIVSSLAGLSKDKDIQFHKLNDGNKTMYIKYLMSILSLTKPYRSGDITKSNAIYIQGQLHSNEVNSFSTLYSLVEKLKNNPPPIPVRIVPSCNPIGWEIFLNGNDGRASFPGKLDWNRIFTSLPTTSDTIELELVNTLWKLSEGFDNVIDVHTPDFGFPHVYAADVKVRLLTFDDLPYAISGEVPDGSFQNLNTAERKIRAFTLELPSYNIWTIFDQEYWSQRIYDEIVAHKNIISIRPDSLPKYFGTMVNLYSNISGVPVLLVEPNVVVKENTEIMKVLGENGESGTVTCKNRCIPLCFRRRGLIQAGRMVAKVLSL